MCKLCRKLMCPPNCPNFDPETGLRCISCGGMISDGDNYYLTNGNPYCTECVEDCGVETLIRICEMESDEFFERAGLERRIYEVGGF